MASQTPPNRHLKLAACAVAFAAAMGGSASASEMQAIEQIEHYCTASWRNAGISHQEWTDCTQQALLELLERVSRGGLSEAIENRESAERRELNRTVWRTIQRWRRSPRLLSLDEARTMDVNTDVSSQQHADAWDQVMHAAEQCLSERQQQILLMTRDGWRVGEIAEELTISAARVSDEKYKAIAKLQSHLDVA
jgi:RNA polymerase sigma factor (sigma-70 family)